VYQQTTAQIVKSVTEGFNGTVFAYGQTSSGKTHTMYGNESEPGIVFLAVKELFERIERDEDREFFVRASYLEIYNEQLIDLLANNREGSKEDDDGGLNVNNNSNITSQMMNLKIQEDPERGIIVNGLKEERVRNIEQVKKLLEIGQNNRHVGATNMNARSSRSHVIFRLCIESKQRNANENVLVSILNLVDLAGSERVAKTGAEGQRAKEGASINKSLLTLGLVINKLAETGDKGKSSSNAAHVPYRDSKLTRILQPALGGNSKTAIVCAMTPCSSHVEETSSTLRFATRAKNVTNQAKRNEVATATAAMIKKQAAEIARLEKKLSSSFSKSASTKKLEEELDQLKQDLSAKDEKIAELQSKLSSSSSSVEVVDESGSECVTNSNQAPIETNKRQQEMTPHTTEAIVALEAKLTEIQNEKDFLSEKMKAMKNEYKAEQKKMFKRAEAAENEIEKMKMDAKKVKLESLAQNSDVLNAKEAIEAALVSRNLELASAVERALVAEKKLEECNRKLKLKSRSEDDDNFELNRKLENVTEEKEELEQALKKKEKKFQQEKKQLLSKVEFAEKQAQEALEKYTNEGDGKLLIELKEKIKVFEKVNVSKMKEIAKLKMEVAQNVSKMIDYETQLITQNNDDDDNPSSSLDAAAAAQNKSENRNANELLQMMKLKIQDLEEEISELQLVKQQNVDAMAVSNNDNNNVTKEEEQSESEALLNDLRFALEEANVQIEKANVEVEKANAEVEKANVERIDMQQMLEEAVVAVEEQARVREQLERTLEEIENRTQQLMTINNNNNHDSSNKEEELEQQQQQQQMIEVKKLCAIYEIKYAKAKEKMKEDLLKIKALQKEISTDKKVKEGLKHEVVKLTKQMEKMQTVYGRLKATKFAPNANAQEFDKVRARKEREYDLEKEQQKNNNNNNNNNNNIEIVAETKLTKSTTSSKTALSEIDSNIVIN